MRIDNNYNHKQQNEYLQQNVNQILKEASKPINNLDIKQKQNPYKDFLNNRAWQVFLESSNGFDERAVDDVKKILFENKNFSNTTAMSLLDWATRAAVISDNIFVPQVNSSNITNFEKSIIANQLQQIIHAKKNNFG